MVEVTLYMRQDCHLCEVVKAQLDTLQALVPHTLKVIDIDYDTRLRALYGFNVPVVLVGPYKLSAPIDELDLKISLMAVQHSQEQEKKLDEAALERRTNFPVNWTKADSLSRWLSNHYLALFNTLVFIYVGLPFLAPVFMKNGATTIANMIYRAYGFVCHQFAFRSWFLFGQQVVYPKIEAGISNLISYQRATGLDGNDLFAARDFEGNIQLGYKVALCERDVAIYAGIFIFGLIFAIFRRRIKPIHWLFWIILGITPIAFDGLSQLISQLPLNLLPLRESTPLLRTITGFLFGFLTAWFGYPYVEESMIENKKYIDGKYQHATKISVQ